jgi:hypothetical protein
VTAVAGEREHQRRVLAPSGHDMEEKERLAQVLASTTAPWVTYGVHTRNPQMVHNTLIGLDWQELAALVVVLASRCAKPLMRPDDGVIDEVLVARACAGEPVPLSGPERVAAAHMLADRGRSKEAIGRILHVSEATVKRLLECAPDEQDDD